MMYLQTVVSEFSARFVQTERANIVQLVTLVSYFVALCMAVRLFRMMQRGDTHFNTSFWRWCMGILFTALFPNFLSSVLLKRQVTEVVMEAPLQPALGEDSGYLEDGQLQEMIGQGEQEKLEPVGQPPANPQDSELGGTVINPGAKPEDFGEDLGL